MQICCHACGTINRVEREGRSGVVVCGRCGEELMPTRPVSLNDLTFERYVASNDQAVLVDFWAKWCAPCRMMGPHFEDAARELPDVRFAKLDVDAHPRAATASAIRAVPTLVLYEAGKEVARHSGMMTGRDLVAWVRRQLSRNG